MAQGLIELIGGIRLLGAEAILVGIRPEVAQTIVGLGLELRAIATETNLEQGIARVDRRAIRR